MSSTAFSPDPQPRKKPLEFAELTPAQIFNLGRVVGLYNEQVRVQKLPDGRLSIMNNMGREITIEEFLEYAKRLKNTL
jgi:hypothetical protein